MARSLMTQSGHQFCIAAIETLLNFTLCEEQCSSLPRPSGKPSNGASMSSRSKRLWLSDSALQADERQGACASRQCRVSSQNTFPSAALEELPTPDRCSPDRLAAPPIGAQSDLLSSLFQQS